MPSALFLLVCSAAMVQPAPELPVTEPFDAPKYGLATRIPKDWTIAVHEDDDRIFVAVIPQKEFDRPGIAACELALAPRVWKSIAPGSIRARRRTGARAASWPRTS